MTTIWDKAFITEEDLRNAVGPNTYRQIFDDDRQGKANPDAVAVVLRRAHGEVMSYLSTNYTNTPTEGAAQAADLYWAAELDYACALAYERHPEYVRNFGKEERDKRWKRAQDRMERITAGIQRVPKAQAEAQNLEPRPKNVGALIVTSGPRTTIDENDPAGGSGDF